MHSSNYKEIEKLTAHQVPSLADQQKLDALENILKKNPHNIPALLKKGFILFQAHADGQAIKVYLYILSIDEQCVDAYVWLGELLLFHWADAERAIPLLKKALAINAMRADVYYLLGCAAQKRDDFTQCVTYFEQAVQLEPSWLIPRLCLIDGLLKVSKKEQARAHAQELQKHTKQTMVTPTDEMQLYYEKMITGRVVTPSMREWRKVKKLIEAVDFYNHRKNVLLH